MKLVFLGPPGAGKGTQAVNVAKRFGVAHISTGDMFRAAIGEKTPTGLKAKAFIDAGQLVPDSVVIEMVEERLGNADCANGYLLDGFPRTVEQAEALKKIAEPDYVVNIDVADEHLMGRLTGRRVCGDCKGSYHITRLANAEVCPDCGGKLVHRPDDQPETIAKRLSVYHSQTAPLIAYYEGAGKLKTVDGASSPEVVFEGILGALEQ